ncbi:MAG: type IV pili methyl-accepting chemotaxis transducer N-terminal domain-containing protein [Desulfobacterium sp.]|nr:type IV pili methyl-accepting chemotaxis transducer N-terminal domain-containing protein [Desulfobacterium sp.]
MAIRYKLGLIVGGLFFIILFMFAVTWQTTSAQKDDGLVINLAGRQRMLSQKMSKELFLLSSMDGQGPEKAKLHAEVKNTMKVFDITLKALSDSGNAPLDLNLEKTLYAECPRAEGAAATQLTAVKGLWQDFSSHMAQVLSNGDQTDPSLQYVKDNNLKLLKEMNTAVGIMQKTSEKKVKRLIFLQSLGMLSGVILMVLSLLQIHGIVRQLLGSTSTAKKLSQGDLTQRFPSQDKPTEKMDEIAYLGHNLNLFIETLQENMKNIRMEAVSLNHSSTDMNQVAKGLSTESESSAQRTESVAQHAEQMSEDMNAVAAAMEELTANTQQIADSTSRMNKTIRDISGNTDNANGISAKAVQRVESASSRVDDLGNAALKISKVSESISEISEQTNLLALNATIEAARAGEAGKGFAVVASEIKGLATQTTQATEEIKKNIDWIQSASGSTVEDIKEIAQVIHEVNDIIKTISLAVEDQTNTVSDIDINVSQGADAIQEVSSNVANTSAASMATSKDIREVSQSITQISSNSSNIHSSSGQLSALAEKLNTMVDHFKLEA